MTTSVKCGVRYLSSWLFDVGVALGAGAVAVRDGWTHLMRAIQAAPMHAVDSAPQSGVTFAASYSDPVFVGWRVIVGVLSVGIGLVLMTTGVVQVNRRS
jgi:hypothetical protein